MSREFYSDIYDAVSLNFQAPKDYSVVTFVTNRYIREYSFFHRVSLVTFVTLHWGKKCPRILSVTFVTL